MVETVFTKKLIPCAACGHKISPTAPRCPNCGRKGKHAMQSEVIIKVIGLIVAIVFGGIAIAIANGH